MGIEKKKDVRALVHPSFAPGLAYWRVLWPLYQLMMRKEIIYSVFEGYLIDSLPYVLSDIVVLQRLTGGDAADYIKHLASIKEKAEFRLVYDVDDIIFFEEVPDYHYGKKNLKNPEAVGLSKEEMIKRCKRDEAHTIELMELCDEITVSTPFLKDFYSKKLTNQNITVLKNKIPFFWAGNYYSEEMLLRNYRKYKSKPRIIYAGSSSHVDTEEINEGKDDFAGVIDVIIKTRHEFTWIFVGACPPKLKEYTKTKEIEYWGWSPIGLLPQTIMQREGNMMVAPLADNLFNRAKSNIKFQEACAYGLPIACQDLNPYEEAPIKFKTGEEMIQRIRETLRSEDTFLQASRQARATADENWLEVEENITTFKDVYTYPYGDSRRSTQ